jgi:hypothetical protein
VRLSLIPEWPPADPPPAAAPVEIPLTIAGRRVVATVVDVHTGRGWARIDISLPDGWWTGLFDTVRCVP